MTTYKARTYRSGDWWAVEITEGLPADTLGVTQVRRLTNAEQAARDVIADLLDVGADTIDVDLQLDIPVAVKKAQLQLERLEADLETARQAQKRARRELAAAAIDEGLTMREAGLLLGVSHQRVKQLIDDSELIA